MLPQMPWPFRRSRAPRSQTRATIETIYGMIVAQAREPLFYQAYGTPDTVDGRFDMVVLHLWLVLRALRPHEGRHALAQALFDRFCSDMDHNLREMGVGDLAVPRRMRALGEAFYGRMAAYDAAAAQGREALAKALNKNILNGADPAGALRLAGYAEAAAAVLSKLEATTLAGGAFRFPAPSAKD